MKIDIIDSYDKLPIGLYLKILEAEQSLTTEIDRAVSRIAFLTGLTDREVLNLELPVFQDLCGKSLFLEKDSTRKRVATKYVVGDYILIPCLEVRKMTTGQYIDFQAYSQDSAKYIVDILSCFLIPKGLTYNEGYDIEDVKAQIRDNLSVCDVNALADFFLHSLIESIRASLSCSERAARRMKNCPKKTELLRKIAEQQTLLRKNGDGYGSLTWCRKLSEISGT